MTAAPDNPPAGAKDLPTATGAPPPPSKPGQGAGIGTQDKWFFHTDGIAAPVLTRFREAIVATQRRHDLAVCASVDPVMVRAGSTGSPPAAARLVLPLAAIPVLGGDFESHLLLGDGELLIWLAGMDELPVGSGITLLALSEAGPVQTTAVVGERESPIRLRLRWGDPKLPQEIAFAVSHATDGSTNE